MLSVVITAWNEEKTLPQAVASVKGLADEIVVVDTESTDGTIDVAKKLGCRVYKHKNTGIVEPVRNFSISKAQGDWVLLLDADEELSPQLLDLIPRLISQGPDYFRIPRKNLIFGKWIRSRHWWPDYVFRLFKKGSVVWEDTIHSVPSTRGIGVDLPADPETCIVHHHYSSISQYVQRIDRYTDHLLRHLQDNGYKFSWADLITKPSQEFIRQYFARGGYVDGLHGLALACLQAFSETVLYLKAWESESFSQKELPLAEVAKNFSSVSKEYLWWDFQVNLDRSPAFLKPFLKLIRKISI